MSQILNSFPKTKHEYLIRNFVFWTGLVFSMLCVTIPFLRYLFFLLPFLVLIAVLADGKSRLGEEAIPFYVFVIAGIILSPLATKEGIKDLFLTFAGISIAMLFDVPRIKLWSIFIIFLIGTIIFFALFGRFENGFEFDIMHSKSPFESNFGFMYGLLAVFAIVERKFALYLLSLTMSIICLKRIAVIGAIASALFFFLGEKKGKLILNPIIMVIVNCILVLMVLSYGYGLLDNVIYDLTGQSANEFGLGRRVLLSIPSREIIDKPLEFIFYGKGPGSTYELANEGAAQYGKANLHSDLVKLLYEYGLVFYCLFIAAMYSVKKYSTRLAFLFMNVLFLSDNTLIYYFLLFILVYCSRIVENSRKINNDCD